MELRAHHKQLARARLLPNHRLGPHPPRTGAMQVELRTHTVLLTSQAVIVLEGWLPAFA